MRRPLAVLALLAGVLLASPAAAVPTGGASPDTPGTSASVSPRSLAAGTTISFTVGGFPAGEVVYVKIDDGGYCDQQGVHGACVVHQQRIGADGRVAGSFVLPAGLPTGAHWLRFLASEELTDDQGAYLGVKGYTRRGGADFRVVASSGTTTAPTTAAPTPTATASTSTVPTATASTSELPASTVPGAAQTAGGVLTLAPGDEDRATASPTPTASPANPASAPVATVAAASTEDHFPVVGVAGLVGLLVAAGALVLRARLRG